MLYISSLLFLVPLYGVLVAGIALVGLLLAIGAYRNSARLWGRMALLDTQAPQQGYLAPQYSQALLGQQGISQTPLRPAGKVRIQGCTYQATTEGTYLAPQEAVVVIAIMGHTLVVQSFSSV